MNAQIFIVILFAVIAVISAVMVISLPNPVHSALSLILNLVSLAVLYYTLNAPFLMAVQLIVYAGAIVVLFLFVVMLLSTRGDASEHPHLAWLKPAAMVGAILFLGGIIAAVKFATQRPTMAMAAASPIGDPASIGRMLYRAYLLPFEATSILLLAGLVGAMYLGRQGDRGEIDDYGLEAPALEEPAEPREVTHAGA